MNSTETQNDKDNALSSEEKQIQYLKLVGTEALGSGTFGRVNKCYYRNEDGERRDAAIKCLRNKADEKSFADEARYMRTLTNQHPYCVQFYGSHKFPDSTVGLVMELMDCGNLGELLKNNKMIYTIDHIVSWMYQLSVAVDYIHSEKAIHRDLKVENLLLGDHYRCLKVGDFGAITRHSTNIAGSPVTMAPEVYRNDPNKPYTNKCDIYSVGIIIWMVLSRRDPYELTEDSRNILFRVAYKGLRPPELQDNTLENPAITEFYKRCWDNNPDVRPTAKELVLFFTAQMEEHPNGGELLVESSEPAETSHPHNEVDLTIQVIAEETFRIIPIEQIIKKLNLPEPIKPVAGKDSKRSQRLNVEYVDSCYQLYSIEEALAKELALKHDAIAELDDNVKYIRRIERKIELENMKAEYEAYNRLNNQEESNILEEESQGPAV